jgi:CrcB protein
MNVNLRSYALIALGGFTGSASRYLIDEQIMSLAGILLVNVIGCFFLGIFMYESIYIGRFSRNSRLFFGVGAIGSFTTFSALAVQSFALMPVTGMVNLLANVVLGLAGVLAGRHFISWHRGI